MLTATDSEHLVPIIVTTRLGLITTTVCIASTDISTIRTEIISTVTLITILLKIYANKYKHPHFFSYAKM